MSSGQVNTLRQVVFLSLIFMLCVVGYTISDNNGTGTGGVIKFSGQIVEGMCKITPNARYIDIECDRAGKNLTARYSIDADRHEKTTGIPTTRVQWLNAEHTLGIVVITYE